MVTRVLRAAIEDVLLPREAYQVPLDEDGNPEPSPATKVQVKRTSLADTVFSATTSFVTGAVETVVLFYFLLAYGEVVLRKLIKVLPHFDDKQRAIEIARATEAAVSAYLTTALVVNVVEGAVVAGVLWLLGMPNPLLWGALVMLLELTAPK